jgi:ABC-type Zn uptake system ZnuABC Zn-binding protein ZnuA
MIRIASILGILAALTTPGLAQERLRVVATTSDLRSLAKAVGQERVIVSSLVPAGKRVDEYPLRLTDVAILKGAHVVVRAGAGIDPWFDQLLARAAQKNGRTGIDRGESGYIDASAAIAHNDPLSISAGFAPGPFAPRGGGSSPHYWLDPKTAEAITASILATYMRLDPGNKSYYENNRQAFLDRLNAKLSEWTARLLPLREKPLLAFHDDWAYFANRFRLNIVDFIASRDRAPPKRAKLRQLAKLIKERGIRLIIAEANQPERHANRLARQTGAKVVLLAGTVGELPNADDYIAMFEANVNALVAANEKK